MILKVKKSDVPKQCTGIPVGPHIVHSFLYCVVRVTFNDWTIYIFCMQPNSVMLPVVLAVYVIVWFYSLKFNISNSIRELE